MTPATLISTAARYERSYGCRKGDGGTADQLRAGAAAMYKLQAMHRRAQQAEGKMSRTDVLLRSVHGYIKHVHEKKDTNILWYWMRQHLRSAMEHARAGTGRAFSVHFTYYHDQLLDLQAKLAAAEAKLAALQGDPK